MSEERKRRISKLAITSVLCGIYPFLFMLSRIIFPGKGPAYPVPLVVIIGYLLCIPFPIIAIVNGVRALSEISKDNNNLKGKGFAMVGIILGAIPITLAAIAISIYFIYLFTHLDTA